MQKVVKLDYQRNGVTGRGFYVGIVKEIEDGEERQMLVIRFNNEDVGDILCAAFDLALLKNEDIEFGSNSWRGDHYHEVMDKAINKLKED